MQMLKAREGEKLCHFNYRLSCFSKMTHLLFCCLGELRELLLLFLEILFRFCLVNVASYRNYQHNRTLNRTLNGELFYTIIVKSVLGVTAYSGLRIHKSHFRLSAKL